MELKVFIHLVTPLPLLPFTTEEILDCTNEVARGSKKSSKKSAFLFFLFLSCFTVSVTPSLYRPGSSNDFMILLISFIFSFEINRLIPFLALAVPFALFFFFQIYLLHLKLNCLLIQVHYL